MPEFTDPFSSFGMKTKLTLAELVRAVRLDIAAEHEAVHLYMSHADATDHPLAKKVLEDIANEERVHVGEFERLLEILTGDEDRFTAEGRAEVESMAAEVEKLPGKDTDKDAFIQEPATIGSLKKGN